MQLEIPLSVSQQRYRQGPFKPGVCGNQSPQKLGHARNFQWIIVIPVKIICSLTWLIDQEISNFPLWKDLHVYWRNSRQYNQHCLRTETETETGRNPPINHTRKELTATRRAARKGRNVRAMAMEVRCLLPLHALSTDVAETAERVHWRRRHENRGINERPSVSPKTPHASASSN